MTSLNLYSHLVKLVLIGFISSGEETEVLRVTWPWPAAPGPLEGVSKASCPSSQLISSLPSGQGPCSLYVTSTLAHSQAQGFWGQLVACNLRSEASEGRGSCGKVSVCLRVCSYTQACAHTHTHTRGRFIYSCHVPAPWVPATCSPALLLRRSP